jgi:cation:H+ antiporter
VISDIVVGTVIGHARGHDRLATELIGLPGRLCQDYQTGGVIVSTGSAVGVFVAGVVVSLALSWLLVSRLERIGARLGLSEALLGLLAALAADAPEITSAATALTHHQQRVGAGVVLGSNVFNLAALLGLGAVVAGRIVLHRRVVLLGGAVAIWVAAVSVTAVTGMLPPGAALVLALAVLVPYTVLLGLSRRALSRLRLPARWTGWLAMAITEEEAELDPVIHPRRGRLSDALVVAVALSGVVAASVVMERAASAIGSRYAVPQIITGGLALAVITSLPNAVAAFYLAARGRGAAVLSTALNSNTLNVAAGLLIPATLLGLGPPSGQAIMVTAWYLGLTIAVLAFAYRHRGITRAVGVLIITAYLIFAVSLWVSAAAGSLDPRVVIAPPAVFGAAAGAWALLRTRHRPPGAAPSPPAAGTSVNGDQPAPPPGRRSGYAPLLPGVPASRLFLIGLALCVVIAGVDALTGRHLILIGLLIVGPCCVLLSGAWFRTAVTGLLAVALAIVCGVPDGIWGTVTHLMFIAAVTVVAAATTVAAVITGKHRAARCQ